MDDAGPTSDCLSSGNFRSAQLYWLAPKSGRIISFRGSTHLAVCFLCLFVFSFLLVFIIVWKVCKILFTVPFNKPLFGPRFLFLQNLKPYNTNMYVGYSCMHECIFVSMRFKPLVDSSRSCSVPSGDKEPLLRSVRLSKECWTVESIRICNPSTDFWNPLSLIADLRDIRNDNPSRFF